VVPDDGNGMLCAEAASVVDHEQTLGLQIGQKMLKVLGNGDVTVIGAIDGMVEDGDRSFSVIGKIDADLGLFDVGRKGTLAAILNLEG